MADDPRLADKVVLGHLGPDKIGVGHGGGVGDGNGVLEDGLDGPPDVDDLVAAREHLVGVGGELPAQPPLGAMVRLVDVRSGDGPAVGQVVQAQVVPLRWAAPHLVVEDVDKPRPRRGFDELLALCVVAASDLLLVGEGLLAALVPAVLESVAVERVLVLVAADVRHHKVPCLVRPFVADSALADEDGRRLGAITGVVPVV